MIYLIYRKIEPSLTRAVFLNFQSIDFVSKIYYHSHVNRIHHNPSMYASSFCYIHVNSIILLALHIYIQIKSKL